MCFEKSLATWQAVFDRGERSDFLQVQLAVCQIAVARLTDRLDEAESLLGKAIQGLQTMLDADQSSQQIRSLLKSAALDAATLHSELKKYDLAVADWEMFISLGGTNSDRDQTGLGLALGRAKKFVRAAAIAESLAKTQEPLLLADAAHIYALLSILAESKEAVSADEGTLGTAYAEKAVALLLAAAELGTFEDKNTINWLRTAADLEPLRSFQAFRDLVHKAERQLESK
jgi:hypothetical protein